MYQFKKSKVLSKQFLENNTKNVCGGFSMRDFVAQELVGHHYEVWNYETIMKQKGILTSGRGREGGVTYDQLPVITLQ